MRKLHGTENWRISAARRAFVPTKFESTRNRGNAMQTIADRCGEKMDSGLVLAGEFAAQRTRLLLQHSVVL